MKNLIVILTIIIVVVGTAVTVQKEMIDNTVQNRSEETVQSEINNSGRLTGSEDAVNTYSGKAEGSTESDSQENGDQVKMADTPKANDKLSQIENKDLTAGLIPADNHSGADAPTSYRIEMKNFVIDISQYAKTKNRSFQLMSNNGLGLLLAEGSGTWAGHDLLDSLDAMNLEELFWGWEMNDDQKTPQNIQKEFLEITRDLQTMGVSIFNIDYAAERSHVDDAYQSNGRQGIIPFVANSRLLDTLPGYPAPVYRNNDHDMISLKDAENFLCLINPQNYSSKDQYLTALRNTDYDVLIIDFCFDGQPLTAADIAKIKVKKNGGKRLVLAYMSIGEAEDYRFYWQSSWSKERPGWIAEENAEWPGNYLVKYWDTAWQEIIFGHSYSYLDRVMAAGFSGVFLDLLDAYQYFEE